MRKFNALLNASKKDNSQFNQLVASANQHLTLQQFWQATAPLAISQLSNVGNLKNETLTVFAHNNSVAAKIKFISASLLTQLQNLQKSDPYYKQYKLTRIRVKVQVKSHKTPKISASRTLSSSAATTLRNLATSLGDTSLADKLNKLADKS
jgi:hypothetical protein